MKLYTNGCSFTWGDELSDRNLRFAGLLANKFNCELIDDSMCGASNERILRTTLDYLQNPNTDLENLMVVIGWSGISRKEIYNNGWNKITPTMIGTNDVATRYYSKIQSVQQDNLNFYYQTLLLQTKMMIKDGSKREVTDGYDTSYLTKEQAKDININTFPSYLSNGMTFREYALRNGGGLKPNRHPDEKSHELFTEHIYENLC